MIIKVKVGLSERYNVKIGWGEIHVYVNYELALPIYKPMKIITSNGLSRLNS